MLAVPVEFPQVLPWVNSFAGFGFCWSGRAGLPSVTSLRQGEERVYDHGFGRAK